MLYTLYYGSRSCVSFFSMHKLRVYAEANPSTNGWYTVRDGRKPPKHLTLEDIRNKEIRELDRRLQQLWYSNK
jgi:hypothetical protein